MKPLTLIFSISILFFTQCSFEKNTDYLNKVKHPELFLSAMQNLTDIVVYDIFSPPVASRVYLYPTLAAYEIMAQAYPDQYATLVGQVKDLQTIPVPDNDDVNPHLSALFAFNTVGKTLIFSENKMETFEENFLNQLDEYDVPRRAIKASKEHGNSVAKTILEWASKDMYNQTRTFPKYTIREEDQFWKPTPPDYMDGIEPHWKEIRTMVLDSSNQFEPKPPLPFDLTDGSPFQKQLMEVFEIGNKLNEEQVEIAKFWDCNPYVTHHRGHAMFATKKITPGGHWIGITAITTRLAGSSFEDTVNAYANVTIALFDAFISCWDEKWDTLIVRPETLINQYYDEEWLPLLQTPPFPEYTSGHSVISRAAAVTLTDLYGDNFSFTDTTEVAYGLPERKYTSFLHASEEAAISRLYGGIHYMMAIEEGVAQGESVGNYVVEKIQTKKQEK
ncbi:MAG: vanadium-dependent haloperoxidase [Bacteroidetes bacterium]|nr:vanadium-dependent haloperoxidase [Bacteroidota bacterium]MDA0922683.1 vanadium-dependent haloperoxidase [Bacteroidota bacterium]MDA1288920.1 vanadium-dependent haloperoxidase [Bacteroidota bacterium]